ncbi:MAG TPA: hypothetical protein PKE32_01275 [Miltoncostaeaceae bacterium]|nr:hypothetical protein [Miltoncostaeaceae bacterium]
MIAVVHLPHLALRVALRAGGHPPDIPAALAPAPTDPPVIGPCTPRAGADGLHPGLSVGEAYARCPQLTLVDAHPEAVAALRRNVVERLRDDGHAVATLAENDLASDLRPLVRLHGGFRAALARLQRRLPIGLDGRIGVAAGVFAAAQAARMAATARPHIVPDADTAAFLAPLSLERLPLTPEAVQRCRSVGLTRIGQFADLSRSAARECLGSLDLTAWELARGAPGPPPQPDRPAPAIRARIAFSTPLAGAQPLQAACRLLAQRLADALSGGGRLAGALDIGAELADGGSWNERAVLRQPTDDRQPIARALWRRLATIPGPVGALCATADGLHPARGRQLDLLDSPHRQRLARNHEAIRHVRAALGDDALLRIITLDEHALLPERRYALAPAPDPPRDP